MTLKHFLETEVKEVEQEKRNYRFIYKEVWCLGVLFSGPFGEGMRIRPISSALDIGLGAGAGMTVFFDKEPRKSELLDTLEAILQSAKKDVGHGSFGHFYYVMWNDKECIGELLTRLIAEERSKL